MMRKDGAKMASVILLVLVVVTMASFAQIYMKRGLNNRGGIELRELLSSKLISTILDPSVFTGFVLYLLSAAIWLAIISKAELSFVYPMIALGYILTAFLARYYFNENITLIRWFGILLILGGVFLITRS